MYWSPMGPPAPCCRQPASPRAQPSEAWVLEQPEEIKKLHRTYLDAGSELILTSTFGGTQARLRSAGPALASRVAEINRRAGELAREEAGPDVYVGGDIGPSGELMKPLGPLTYETAVEMFAEQAGALAAGDIDCIYIETMTDLNEAKAAVDGARQVCDLPVFCTFSFDTHGRTGMGLTPQQAAAAMAELNVDATGANCGHAPEEVVQLLSQMRDAAPDIPLIAKPNAGVPHMVKRQAVYDATPERMAALARKYVTQGASIVGACCGSSPAHIAAIAEAVRANG